MNQGHQLGDFIKGRVAFIEEMCTRRNLDFANTRSRIETAALGLARNEEQQTFLKEKVFETSVLPSAKLPDWVDNLILTAIAQVIDGPGATLVSSSSSRPCIPFEAGRFNAKRQAESVFKLMFDGKKIEDWLDRTFPIIYSRCYGNKAAEGLKGEQPEPGRFTLSLNNQNLDKAGPMDCTTIVGYLTGALEALGAKDVVVDHTNCGVKSAASPGPCIYQARWSE